MSDSGADEFYFTIYFVSLIHICSLFFYFLYVNRKLILRTFSYLWASSWASVRFSGSKWSTMNSHLPLPHTSRTSSLYIPLFHYSATAGWPTSSVVSPEVIYPIIAVNFFSSLAILCEIFIRCFHELLFIKRINHIFSSHFLKKNRY